MKTRTVMAVVPSARQLEGGGFEVTRPFPTSVLEMFDPFLLLDEMGPVEVAPGQAKGAPDHPHRGFETVTYVLDGQLEHKDSAGNAGALGPGDVQWMTAGAGVVHAEMPSREFLERGGRLHGFQLWVNLPRADKMMKPRYQDIPAARIPKATSADGRVTARVIAGEALGQRAVIDTRTPITYVHFTIAPGGAVELPVDPAHNVFAYVSSGEVDAGPESARAGASKLIAFEPDGDAVTLAVAADAVAPAEVLVIGGLPLREPVARYGPFVMNTRGEILQAIEDHQAGRLGRIDR